MGRVSKPASQAVGMTANPLYASVQGTDSPAQATSSAPLIPNPLYESSTPTSPLSNSLAANMAHAVAPSDSNRSLVNSVAHMGNETTEYIELNNSSNPTYSTVSPSRSHQFSDAYPSGARTAEAIYDAPSLVPRRPSFAIKSGYEDPSHEQGQRVAWTEDLDA